MDVVIRGTFRQQVSCVFDGNRTSLMVLTAESVVKTSASEQEPAQPLRE